MHETSGYLRNSSQTSSVSMSKNRQLQPVPQLLHFEVPPCKADLRPANPQFDATTIGHHENSCCSWPWPPGNEGSRLKRIGKGTLLEESNVTSSCMSCILLWIYMTSHLSRNTNGKDSETKEWNGRKQVISPQESSSFGLVITMATWGSSSTPPLPCLRASLRPTLPLDVAKRLPHNPKACLWDMSLEDALVIHRWNLSEDSRFFGGNMGNTRAVCMTSCSYNSWNVIVIKQTCWQFLGFHIWKGYLCCLVFQCHPQNKTVRTGKSWEDEKALH